MPQIKYVGAKEDGETAFVRETNITWLPGDTHEIGDALARRMLLHPDVFALDEGAAPASVEPVLIKLPDGALRDIGALSVDVLRALAKDLGVQVDGRSGAPKIIKALTSAFPAE